MRIMPAWATVAIALGAAGIGALSGLGGAYLSLTAKRLDITHQERDAWTARSVQATQDFSTNWSLAFSEIAAIGQPGGAPPDFAAVQRAIHQQVSATVPALARVGILFGPNSAVFIRADKALSELDKANRALAGPNRAIEEFAEAGKSANSEHDAFLLAAYEATRPGVSKPAAP
jgi:hypothetical protein